MDTWHRKIDNCLHCKSEDIENIGFTDHGYPRFKCHDCKKTFNQRTGTPFNRLEIPTDIALQVVRWYLQYKLSLRDLIDETVLWVKCKECYLYRAIDRRGQLVDCMRS